MKLGISSYTYGWAIGEGALDENDLLERARDFGVSLLQIGDNLPLHTFSDERLRALKTNADEWGVELEIGARRLTTSHIETYANIARFLDAKLLRFVIDTKDYEPSAEDVISILRDSLPLLENVTLGIENHDRFRAATLAHIVESVGSERVGICLDTANSLGAGEGLNEVLRVLDKHTVNLHIKDFNITRVPYLMGFVVEGAVAGTGFVDVENVLNSLQPFARCRTAILETWVPPERDMNATIEKEARWARESMTYLKKFDWI